MSVLLFIGLWNNFSNWKKSVVRLLRRFRKKRKILSARLYRLDMRVGRPLNRLINIYWKGASLPPKPRTGHPVKDFILGKLLGFLRVLNKFDRMTFYRDRPYSTRGNGCVRSKLEQRFANWLTDQGFRYKYEAPVEIEGKVLHPDFHLYDHDIYVEVWGMMYDPKYRGIRRSKEKLYEKGGFRILHIAQPSPNVSLTPKVWDKMFWEQFRELTQNRAEEMKRLRVKAHTCGNSSQEKASIGESKMKLITSIVVVILCVGAFMYFVFPSFKDVIGDGHSKIDKSLSDNVSDEYLFQKMAEELGKKKEDLIDDQLTIAQAEHDLVKQETTIKNHQRHIEKNDRAIKDRYAWLTAEGRRKSDKFKHGNRLYDYQTVAMDVKTRADESRKLREAVQVLSKAATESRRVINSGKETIQTALTKIRQKEGELKSMQVQAAVYKVAEQTRALVSGIKISHDANIDSRYANEIERRMQKRKARLELAGDYSVSGGIIPLDNDVVDESMTAVESYMSEFMADDSADPIDIPVVEPTQSIIPIS